jgi:polyhydroxybutyrate depolymerase
MKQWKKIVFYFLLLIPLTGTIYIYKYKSTGGKLIKGKMNFGGLTRTYECYLPKSYDGTTPLPMVLCFHGLGSTAEGQRYLTKFDQVAEKHNFIVVFPESTKLEDGTVSKGWGKQWNAGYDTPQAAAGIDDTGFVSTLIDQLTEKLTVDKRRIYATGASNGAVFTQLLAVKLSDKIAAAASVIGALAEPVAKKSHPLRPISILLMMSDTDPIMNFNGLPGTFLSAHDTVDYWLENNDITAKAVTTELPETAKGDKTTVRLDEYDGGSSGTKVIFYTVEGAGHTWPGGLQYAPEKTVGKVSLQINASEVIWEFFKNITLPDATENK